VEAEHGTDQLVYRIRDEGPGFNHRSQVKKPLVETSALHGRGITLIRHYMDEVTWNDEGSEIRMVKQVQRAPPE
jgi:anti-sigma regulatory factor (Ser/Thr protein kinase)